MSAPATCAKIGGASPTGPKSIAPTFSASSGGGYVGNSVHANSWPRGLSLSSGVPLDELSVFLVADTDDLVLSVGYSTDAVMILIDKLATVINRSSERRSHSPSFDVV
jgi:hypothetical protein